MRAAAIGAVAGFVAGFLGVAWLVRNMQGVK